MRGRGSIKYRERITKARNSCSDNDGVIRAEEEGGNGLSVPDTCGSRSSSEQSGPQESHDRLVLARERR
jgi:hypothetical protein